VRAIRVLADAGCRPAEGQFKAPGPRVQYALRRERRKIMQRAFAARAFARQVK